MVSRYSVKSFDHVEKATYHGAGPFQTKPEARGQLRSIAAKHWPGAGVRRPHNGSKDALLVLGPTGACIATVSVERVQIDPGEE